MTHLVVYAKCEIKQKRWIDQKRRDGILIYNQNRLEN
jgi:hypothetical protein